EAGFYAQQLHDPLGLACLVARLLVSPGVGDDPGNLPARRRKRAGGDAGWREAVLITGRTGCGQRRQAEQEEGQGGECPMAAVLPPRGRLCQCVRMQAPNFYSHAGFERAGLRRRDTAWILERIVDSGSLFVPVWRN